MSKLVKKVGKKEYYEIDGIRAGGIIPYYIINNKVWILVNQEYRNNELVYNILGGKVDKEDKKIQDTLMREFNEETGYLLSDKIEKDDLNKNTFYFNKAKYLLSLIKIEKDDFWYKIPNIYHNTFGCFDKDTHRDSEKLEWISLFDFDKDNTNFLLNMALYKLKNCSLFYKYNLDEPLFIED